MPTQRVPVKIGTNVIANRASRILRPVLRNLARQLGELSERGIASVVVSSGSILAGMESLGHIEATDAPALSSWVAAPPGGGRTPGIRRGGER